MQPTLTTESVDDKSLRWTFPALPDLVFFEGHFPGQPILPGVVALAWMISAAGRFRGHPIDATSLLNVKFQVPILPGAELELIIVSKTGNFLQATLRSAAGIHASALIPGQDG